MKKKELKSIPIAKANMEVMHDIAVAGKGKRGVITVQNVKNGAEEVLVLNANHPLVKFVAENQESEHVPVICEQLYDLAMMSHKQLSPEEMTKFVKRSNDILMVLTK